MASGALFCSYTMKRRTSETNFQLDTRILQNQGSLRCDSGVDIFKVLDAKSNETFVLKICSENYLSKEVNDRLSVEAETVKYLNQTGCRNMIKYIDCGKVHPLGYSGYLYQPLGIPVENLGLEFDLVRMMNDGKGCLSGIHSFGFWIYSHRC